jgi:predicted amidophosphoribosyltransferase
MSFEICAGYCPDCGNPVEYDKETDVCRCTTCEWEEGRNRT